MAHHEHDPSPPSNSTISAKHLLYTQVEIYPWSADRDFQSGLVAILGPSPSSSPASQLEDLTLRARCFYFTRKYDTSVDFSEYKAWRNVQPAATLSPLVLNTVTESPITPSSTRSPLWPHMDDMAPYQSPNGVGLGSPSGHTDESLTVDGASESSSQQKAYQTQPDLPERPSFQPHYPSSFEEIMHLIQSGQPIPGIKDIPDTVLVGQGTEATRNKRKKPWEKESVDSSQLHESSNPC